MKSPAVVTLLSILCCRVFAAGQPNILWIITDDQRPDSIGAFNRIVHGGSNGPLGKVLSPNVDRLAAMGTTFINTFNQNPGCAPSRTAMHTGRYSHRTGVYGFEYYNPAGQAFWRPMVPEILRDRAGYQTITVGKQGIRARHFGGTQGRKGPLLYETDLGYRNEFAAKGLVEWHQETKWSGGMQGPKIETFFLPDGTKLVWPGRADASPGGIRTIQERFHIFRDYRPGGGSAGGDEEGGSAILGGVNPRPGDQTRDANFAGAVLNHLAHAGQDYTDVLGRNQKGPDKSKPVFIHCGFEFPHTPVLPPAEFREKFKNLRYEIPRFTPEEFAGFPPQIAKAFKSEGSDHFTDAEKQQMVSDYYAYCAYGDALVGTLTDGFIRFSEGQGRPWLILYVCGDNGWKLNEHGMISKFLHYDHDLHNPMIAVSSDKKHFPASKVVTDFTGFVDMAPTFLAAAGIDVAKTEYRYLDGRDLAKTAAGAVRPRDYIIAEPTWVCGPRAVIRTSDYKFAMKIRSYNGNAILPGAAGKDVDWAIKADLKDIEPVLFDLRVDPEEIRNVAYDPHCRPVLDALRTKVQNIVLGDGRVEVAWGKQGNGSPAEISDFAPGADDGRLDVPVVAPAAPPHCESAGAGPAQPTFLPGEDPKPAGRVWKHVRLLSDEFDGDALDRAKWQDDPTANGWGWYGRAPGLFRAENVKLEDGRMCVTVSKLDAPVVRGGKTFTHQGAIVRSVHPGRPGWYFECRMKANATVMSSTFWLITKPSGGKGGLELDIQECIGLVTEKTEPWARKWDRIFHSNLIHWTRPAKVQLQGSVPTPTKNSERFYVYGAWWKSPEEVRFYLDGNYVYSIKPKVAWDAPSFIQMAVETYDWNPIPEDGGLVETGTREQRTTQYDWVRTWELADEGVAPMDASASRRGEATPVERPNVILVLTDDQGYGDMACHGNPWLRTPNLDRLHAEGVCLEDYHVDPVCTPTRAALMTGRYCTRVGAWAVTEGRQLLDPRETTMADVFAASGYRTGLFGKWHLGDAYPFAPQYRGFRDVVCHRAGGVDEIGNPAENDFFDDTYFRNGMPEQFRGYCTDIWFHEALRFVRETGNAGQPFFVYLPLNAMHSPFAVAEKYRRRFTEQGIPGERAKFCGMIENFDENLGRLLDALREQGLERNTIVIFMGDNGTAAGAGRAAGDGFNAGMRGMKGSVYEGGHRVGCMVRWPARLQPGLKVDRLTTHRDWLPTLIEWCGLTAPEGVRFDGRSIAPLLENRAGDWPDRALVIERQADEIRQGTLESGVRNDVPFAVLTERWRMVNGELYDIGADPGQSRNVAAQHPEVVRRLFAAYRAHYADVMGHGGEPVRFRIGAPEENPTAFTVRDWHPIEGPVIWRPAQLADDSLFVNGFWAVEILRAGRYEFRLSRHPGDAAKPMGAGGARLRLGAVEQRKAVSPADASVSFSLDLQPGPARLQTWLSDAVTGKDRGAYFVEVRLMNPQTHAREGTERRA